MTTKEWCGTQTVLSLERTDRKLESEKKECIQIGDFSQYLVKIENSTMFLKVLIRLKLIYSASQHWNVPWN